MAIKHSSTLSGHLTTESTNQVLDFAGKNVNALVFYTYDAPITVILNDETTEHFIDANDCFGFEDISIRKVKVKENGVELRWHAMCY